MVNGFVYVEVLTGFLKLLYFIFMQCLIFVKIQLFISRFLFIEKKRMGFCYRKFVEDLDMGERYWVIVCFLR